MRVGRTLTRPILTQPRRTARELAATANASVCTVPNKNKPLSISPDAAQEHGAGASLCRVQTKEEVTPFTYAENCKEAQLQ